MEKKQAGCQEVKEVIAKTQETTKEKSKKDRVWEKPVLEDVSERVMAQPYIRFT